MVEKDGDVGEFVASVAKAGEGPGGQVGGLVVPPAELQAATSELSVDLRHGEGLVARVEE